MWLLSKAGVGDFSGSDSLLRKPFDFARDFLQI
jgi:hypothetical protein